MPRLRLRLPKSLLGRLRDPGGFGLIEMMIALTVLAIATTALTGVFVSSHLALRRASQSDTAAVLADKLLERFRAETWDNIALNSTMVATATADPIYTGDPAYTDAVAGLGLITYDPTNPDQTQNAAPNATACNDDPVPVVCNPSRVIPYSDATFSEVAPDGRKYRLDTYITWTCPPVETLGGTPESPTCTGSTGVATAVKVVTVVVRDDTSSTTLAGSPVYRTSTTFDQLGGDSMPTVTVEAPS